MNDTKSPARVRSLIAAKRRGDMDAVARLTRELAALKFVDPKTLPTGGKWKK